MLTLLLPPICLIAACCTDATRAHCAGAPGQLAVFRIVLRHSVEERLLQLADR
jgi:hypothetical protein